MFHLNTLKSVCQKINQGL